MIGIIDYGAGNLKSVSGALAYLTHDWRFITVPEDFNGIEAVILPGVGSFGAAESALAKSGLKELIAAWISDNRKFLGICLGFQLLCEESVESPGSEGFRLLHTTCKRFNGKPGIKVPHMGWNRVEQCSSNKLFRGIERNEMFYFVHSFYVPEYGRAEVFTTDYGERFVSGINQGNVTGVQFHPEKSGEAGLRFIKNWVAS